MVTALALFMTCPAHDSESHRAPGTWWALGQHLFAACLRGFRSLNPKHLLCLLYILQLKAALPQFQAEPRGSVCSHHRPRGRGTLLKMETESLFQQLADTPEKFAK